MNFLIAGFGCGLLLPWGSGCLAAVSAAASCSCFAIGCCGCWLVCLRRPSKRAKARSRKRLLVPVKSESTKSLPKADPGNMKNRTSSSILCTCFCPGFPVYRNRRNDSSHYLLHRCSPYPQMGSLVIVPGSKLVVRMPYFVTPCYFRLIVDCQMKGSSPWQFAASALIGLLAQCFLQDVVEELGLKQSWAASRGIATILDSCSPSDHSFCLTTRRWRR